MVERTGISAKLIQNLRYKRAAQIKTNLIASKQNYLVLIAVKYFRICLNLLTVKYFRICLNLLTVKYFRTCLKLFKLVKRLIYFYKQKNK